MVQPLAPCCGRIDLKLNVAASMPIVDGEAFLQTELSRLLIEAGRCRFRASGSCMHPSIMPGDDLYIGLKGIAEISVGEIAVFRRGWRLLSHRVIGSGADSRGPFIITRPDSLMQGEGDDGPSYEKDILGVVTSIVRKGRPASTCPTKPTFFADIHAILNKNILHAWFFLTPTLIKISTFMQQSYPYGYVARQFFRLSGQNIHYHYHLPHRLCKSIIYRNISPDDLGFALSNEFKGRIDHWILTIYLGNDPTPSASAIFVCHQEGCPYAGWWLGNLWIRFRYRGMGLEKILLAKAEKVLFSLGITELKVRAFIETDKARLSSLGFQKVVERGNENFIKKINGEG